MAGAYQRGQSLRHTRATANGGARARALAAWPVWLSRARAHKTSSASTGADKLPALWQSHGHTHTQTRSREQNIGYFKCILFCAGDGENSSLHLFARFPLRALCRTHEFDELWGIERARTVFSFTICICLFQSEHVSKLIFKKEEKK